MDTPLHAWVARAASRSPEARGVVGADDRVLTYGDLEDASSRLAVALRSLGCRKGDNVAVLMPRSPDRSVAAIAAMKAGCAYVPLDPAAEVTRTAEILRRAGPTAIVAGGCSTELLDLLHARRAPGGARIVWLDEAEGPPSVEFRRGDLAHLPVEGASVDVRGDDLACILFSPGGVGRLRRIPMTHGDIGPLVERMVDDFELGPEDRILGDAPPTVGLSVVDLLAAAAAGGELHQAPEGPESSPDRYPGFLEARGVSIWLTTPWWVSAVARREELEDVDLTRLRYVAWCGDLLPATRLLRWKDRWPGTVFTNLSGTAAAEVICRSFEVADEARGDASGRVVGLSRPHGRTPVPVDGPSGVVPVRWVHPVEIEGVVLQAEEVSACAVVPLDGPDGGGPRVGCAYVPRDGRPLRTDELKERLARDLPREHVPALWLVVDELPMDALGRVDRDLLARMFGGTTTAEAPGRRKITPVEAEAGRRAWASSGWARPAPARSRGS